jgi:HD-like signal output (HDOD) protein
VFAMSNVEAGFSPRDLKILAQAAGVLAAKAGAVLIEVGSSDPDDVILLQGDVELKGGDGATQKVRGGSDSARVPLARLRPRRFQVRALTPVRYIKVSPQFVRATLKPAAVTAAADERRRKLSDAVASSAAPADTADYEVTELLQGEIDEAQDLFVEFTAAVHRDQIPLPSLPAIATRVRQAVGADCGVRELAGIVNGDAAIATKIIRAANSAVYRTGEVTTTVAEAVSRLGVNTTQQLVLSFVMKEIFSTSIDALKSKMRAVWTHTQAMAVGAFVLSREFKVLEPERALLAGLLHDIGVVALIAYAERFPSVWQDAATLDRVLAALQGEVGAMMLARWNFEPEWVRLVAEVDQWQRPTPAADYCALLQVVHYCHRKSLPDGDDQPRSALAAFGWTAVQAHESLTRALGRVRGAATLLH